MSSYPYFYRSWNPIVIAFAGIAAVTAAILLLTQVIYPYVFLVLLCCFIPLLAVYHRPIIGVYLLTLLYPLGSCFFLVQFQQPQRILIYPAELLSLILLFAMILRQLADHQTRSQKGSNRQVFSYKWLIFLASMFVFWSVYPICRSDHIITSAYGLWRCLSSIINVAFLVFYLDSYTKFVKVVIFYCGVAFIYATSAVYATNHAFLIEYPLVTIFNVSVSAHISLFNQAAGFVAPIVGMVPGYGLSAKHDLSMLLFGGVLFALFLSWHYRSGWTRSILVMLILIFQTVFYHAFSRLSIFGSFLVVGFICFSVPEWRKKMIVIVPVFIALNLIAHSFAMVIKPEHMKITDSTKAKIMKVSSKSEFESSSLTGRIRIWRRTIERIQWSKGLGIGPDNLSTDLAYATPHGHNLILTVAAESGVPGALLFIFAFLAIGQYVYHSVFSNPKERNRVWLLQVTFVSATLCALFEYCFDMPVFRQQLWYMLGLLLASMSIMTSECKQR